MKYVKLLKLFLIAAITAGFLSCGKDYSPEEEKYISEIEKFRSEKDEYMVDNPDSPFNSRTKIEFSPLKYYDPDPEFVFKSKLYEYNQKDTVIIFGTKGEERKTIRYGYVKLNYNGKEYKVNVYEGSTDTGEKYYSIWFTDKTTGEETYGVGRYIDFEMNPDKNFVYTIDFNLAYNPYCAYSPDYSCAIPTKEDHIDLAIEAGEKNFH
jgi:uncharacterized protein (DUF1684 family)